VGDDASYTEWGPSRRTFVVRSFGAGLTGGAFGIIP
jgi:hypothetical protein